MSLARALIVRAFLCFMSLLIGFKMRHFTGAKNEAKSGIYFIGMMAVLLP